MVGYVYMGNWSMQWVQSGADQNGAILRCFDWVIALKTQEKLQMYGDVERLNYRHSGLSLVFYT